MQNLATWIMADDYGIPDELFSQTILPPGTLSRANFNLHTN